MSALERRKRARVRCQFPAQLSMIFPEETFSPYTTIVLVSDVSVDGMRVLCPQVGKGIKFRKDQFVRLVLKNNHESARVYCKIMWVRAKQELEGRYYYELGLSYDWRDKKCSENAELFHKRGVATQGTVYGADETPQAHVPN